MWEQERHLRFDPKKSYAVSMEHGLKIFNLQNFPLTNSTIASAFEGGSEVAREPEANFKNITIPTIASNDNTPLLTYSLRANTVLAKT